MNVEREKFPRASLEEEKNSSVLLMSIPEVIERQEFSEDVIRALKAIIEIYPQFADVKIQIEYAEKSTLGAYTFIEDEKGLLFPVLRMPHGGIHRYEKGIKLMPTTVHFFERILDLEEGTLTPQLLQVFLLLHEFGHIFDWKTNYLPKFDNPWDAVDEMEYDRWSALETLPIPGEEPGFILKYIVGGKTLSDLFAEYPNIKNHPHAKEAQDLSSLLALQEREYRDTAPERFADEFAANVIKSDPSTFGFPIESTASQIAA